MGRTVYLPMHVGMKNKTHQNVGKNMPFVVPWYGDPHLIPGRGLVDTEGVRDHVAKARRVDLPHVKFFDTAFDKAAAIYREMVL